MKKKTSKAAWSTLSRKVICKTPHMEVYRDQVVFPDGRTSPYLVMKRHDFAVVVPRLPNGDFIMVRQYRYPLRRNTWEFPMGVVRGVTLLKAAKTELAEETGYRAKKWTLLGKYYVSQGLSDQRAHIYLAEDLTAGAPHPEDGEFVVAKRIPKKQVEQWFKVGRIQDGPSLVAWGMLKK